MVSTLIFGLLGICAVFLAFSSNERIQQRKRNAYVLDYLLTLKLERLAYSFFALLFFLLAALF